jgi:hypothetical protein
MARERMRSALTPRPMAPIPRHSDTKLLPMAPVQSPSATTRTRTVAVPSPRGLVPNLSEANPPPWAVVLRRVFRVAAPINPWHWARTRVRPAINPPRWATTRRPAAIRAWRSVVTTWTRSRRRSTTMSPSTARFTTARPAQSCSPCSRAVPRLPLASITHPLPVTARWHWGHRPRQGVVQRCQREWYIHAEWRV